MASQPWSITSTPEGRAFAQTVQRKGVFPVIITPGDEGEECKEFLYIYNVLNREHVVEQPPLFPHVIIPACPEGEMFAVTLMPRFVNERYEIVGSLPVDYRIKKVDGRRCATSLLNPAAFPGTEFTSQLQQWRPADGQQDQIGNNLNVVGVFWSLTHPDSPELEKEIKLFRDLAQKTMEDLVKQAQMVAATGHPENVTPMMHFAMDYLKRTAPWHIGHKAMIDCPNCGEAINAGLAYHRNSFGERCIIDAERYAQIVAKNKAAVSGKKAQPEAE
jgi:hypothetical protein